jgi:hypothetical protein
MAKRERTEEEVIADLKGLNERIDKLIEKNRKLPLLF